MVQGTFVLSVFSKRDEEKIRMVNFRRTKMRYLVVVIAIFVVFGCEYCFDNASVRTSNIEGFADTHLTQLGPRWQTYH